MFFLLTFSHSVKLQTFQDIHTTAVHDERQSILLMDLILFLFSLQLLCLVSVSVFFKQWSNIWIRIGRESELYRSAVNFCPLLVAFDNVLLQLGG